MDKSLKLFDYLTQCKHHLHYHQSTSGSLHLLYFYSIVIQKHKHFGQCLLQCAVLITKEYKYSLKPGCCQVNMLDAFMSSVPFVAEVCFLWCHVITATWWPHRSMHCVGNTWNTLTGENVVTSVMFSDGSSENSSILFYCQDTQTKNTMFF